MQRDWIEVSVGFFVFLGFLALFGLAIKVSGINDVLNPSGYVISAEFDNIGDLRPRSPVSMAGVKVGKVVNVQLNPTTFRGKVKMLIGQQFANIPKDSNASIFTEGLLGGNYVNIDPGYDEANLQNGDEIMQTQPAIVLERLIGQLMFKITGGSDKDKEKTEKQFAS